MKDVWRLGLQIQGDRDFAVPDSGIGSRQGGVYLEAKQAILRKDEGMGKGEQKEENEIW